MTVSAIVPGRSLAVSVMASVAGMRAMGSLRVSGMIVCFRFRADGQCKRAMARRQCVKIALRFLRAACCLRMMGMRSMIVVLRCVIVRIAGFVADLNDGNAVRIHNRTAMNGRNRILRYETNQREDRAEDGSPERTRARRFRPADSRQGECCARSDCSE